MNSLLPLLLLFCCKFWFTQAITCHEKDYRTSESDRSVDFGTKTCEGKYCLLTGDSSGHPMALSCLNESQYDGFNNRCWNEFGNIGIKCLCNNDYCTDSIQQPKGSVKCGDSTQNCFACHAHNYYNDAYEIPLGEGCDRPASNSITGNEILRWMRPQSCVRFTGGSNYSAVHCVCDTEHFCSARLIEEQTLKSKAVTCYTGSTGTDTCMGDLCFAQHSSSGSRLFDRGCITNNETLFPALYSVGHTTILGNDIAICNKSLCNAGIYSAISGVSTIIKADDL